MLLARIATRSAGFDST
ncbi:hypothetical protein D021_4154A, partial [Vibrio parahaemolyticus 10296]